MILNGKILADKFLQKLKIEVDKLKVKNIRPCLAVCMVGEDPASKVYVKNKQLACEKIGIDTISIHLSSKCSQEEVTDFIQDWNEDPKVHGILVQLPLPKHMDKYEVINCISPRKDVDGFNPINIGNICYNKSQFLPCTPLGIMFLLREINFDFIGKKICIVNDSVVVGKPLAVMLLNEKSTVTVCNEKTPDVKLYTKEADVIVTAVGNRPEFSITADHVKYGAIVIDVGINHIGGKIVGDVDFEEVKNKASYITPVPGCCGPLTISFLLKNTVESAKRYERRKGH